MEIMPLLSIIVDYLFVLFQRIPIIRAYIQFRCLTLGSFFLLLHHTTKAPPLNQFDFTLYSNQ